MGLAGAYLNVGRSANAARPPSERVRDWDDIVDGLPSQERGRQASRCMNCGVPFCQSGIAFSGSRASTGCPLHNLIPEINDLIFQGRVGDAARRLSLTNPFPEFTGHVCPAPCEAACNLGLHDDPVTIHDNERSISEYLWENGMEPLPAVWADAPLVSVVGSGPAGLAAAWELARGGLRVRVYERDDRPGGLLMYGIPAMKLPKGLVERRVRRMAEAGVEFVCGTDAVDEAGRIMRESQAVVLAVGSRVPRRVDVPGADLPGVHFAVDYLTASTRALLDGAAPAIDAKGREVVVVGGGDTGTDCVATALRQGAAGVRQVVRAPRPPDVVDSFGAWPGPRGAYSQGYGQQEAESLFGDDPRLWSTDTVAFSGDGGVSSVRVRDLRAGSPERDIPARLVLIAKGFVGPEQATLRAFGVGPGAADGEGGDGCPVLVAGDARLGSTIVASAMADAMRVARGIVEGTRGQVGRLP